MINGASKLVGWVAAKILFWLDKVSFFLKKTKKRLQLVALVVVITLKNFKRSWKIGSFVRTFKEFFAIDESLV